MTDQAKMLADALVGGTQGRRVAPATVGASFERLVSVIGHRLSRPEPTALINELDEEPHYYAWRIARALEQLGFGSDPELSTLTTDLHRALRDADIAVDASPFPEPPGASIGGYMDADERNVVRRLIGDDEARERRKSQ